MNELALLRELASVARQHDSVILTALGARESHFGAAEREAREHYEAGQADPAVKAAQDATIMTNNGLKHSAEMFADGARRARDARLAFERALYRVDHDGEDPESDDDYQDDERPEVPADYPVRVLSVDDATAVDLMTCGECGRSWDDAERTSMTPTPAGRCPFEAFH